MLSNRLVESLGPICSSEQTGQTLAPYGSWQPASYEYAIDPYPNGQQNPKIDALGPGQCFYGAPFDSHPIRVQKYHRPRRAPVL